MLCAKNQLNFSMKNKPGGEGNIKSLDWNSSRIFKVNESFQNKLESVQ